MQNRSFVKENKEGWRKEVNYYIMQILSCDIKHIYMYVCIYIYIYHATDLSFTFYLMDTTEYKIA